MAGWFRSLVLVVLMLAAFPSFADDAEPSGTVFSKANAIRAADDAFGTVVGLKSVGLYSDTDTRGFSPIDAGNMRIEGLYFDMKITDVAATDLDPCWARETAVRVGLASLAYPFPAPSGVADSSLNVPDGKTRAGLELTRQSPGEEDALLTGGAQVSPTFALSACVGAYHDFSPAAYARSNHLSVGTTGLWLPAEGWQVIPVAFAGRGDAHGMRPRVYSDALELPPALRLETLPGSGFAREAWRQSLLGVVIREQAGERWRFNAGLFHAREAADVWYYDEYLSIARDLTAHRVVDITPANYAASTSGEVRLSRRFAGPGVERSVEFTFRGRRSEETFGGDSLLDLGMVTVGQSVAESLPRFALGPQTLDETLQTAVGAEYLEHRTGIGGLRIGAMRSDYERRLSATGAPAAVERIHPWLLNGRLTLEPSTAVVVFGSFVEGLEDSALAPENATNRGEPPPATRSRQFDMGAQLTLDPGVTVLAGAFSIEKRYFALGSGGAYGDVGAIRHRGLEASLTCGPSDWKVVAGGVWLRATTDGRTVPLGQVPVKLEAQLDGKPANWGPWGASVTWEWRSNRPATLDDRARLPGYGTLDAGLRYEGRSGRAAFAVRLDVLNLLDSIGMQISETGRVTSELGRRAILTVAFDW